MTNELFGRGVIVRVGRKKGWGNGMGLVLPEWLLPTGH